MTKLLYTRLHKVISLTMSATLVLQMLLVSVRYPVAAVSQAYQPDFLGATPLSQPMMPVLPDALAHPISIARMQSSYQAGGTVVVTYTITNNRPVSTSPTIPEAATITETAQILADFDFGADPNTVRDVIVTNGLSTAAVYLSASEPPDRQGDAFIWKLGDIPPQAQRTFSVTVQVPATAADFVALDSGAVAYGVLQGRMVAGQAAAAVLAPDGFAQWLVWTPDADIYDAHMLDQTARLEPSAESIFHYVRSLDFEVYPGSLRGTRGTLWSAAGNSVDQASLLIAMLRAHGIPARYRHGNLATADAQQLILSMFPTPTQILGHIPPGTEVSDPANDPDLIAEMQEHWWVEAYLPGSSWTDLDPSFATAAIGDTFATPAAGGTDRIAELPDELRHKVHLSVKAEQYYAFPMGGPNLQYLTPLEVTLNSVELVGKPVNVAFDVATESQGGLVFGNVIHTYTPYLSLGVAEILLHGDSFSDLLTTFPLATHFTTGIWLTTQTETPTGEITTYEREIKDRIGVAARLHGGQLDLPPLDENPFITITDVIQLHVVPQSHSSWEAVARISGKINALAAAVGDALIELDILDLNDNSATTAWIANHTETLRAADMATLERLGATYYAMASDRGKEIAAGQFVKSYPAAPKLLLMSQATDPDTRSLSFELLNIHERSIAYPGQARQATVAANFARTISDKGIEYLLLGHLGADQTHSALRTFQAAMEAEIPLVMVSESNLDDLTPLSISAEAKARITQAVMTGMLVFVPSEPVSLDGDASMSWLEVDETGHVSYVNEQGQKAASLVSYVKFIIGLLPAWGSGSAAAAGSIGTILLFVANVMNWPTSPPGVNDLLGDPAGAILEDLKLHIVKALLEAAEDMLKACYLLASGFAWPCAGGVMATVANLMPIVLLYTHSQDPPLPGLLFQRIEEQHDEPWATAVLTTTASDSAATLEVSATTTHANLLGSAEMGWDGNGQQGFTAVSLTAAQVDLYAGASLLDSGPLALSQPAQVSLSEATVSALLTGHGSHSFFAPAVSGLGGGSVWHNYTAELHSNQPFSLVLHDTIVTVNGSPYVGTFTAVSHSEAQVSGYSAGPMPQFQPTATVGLENGRLNLGPLTGTVLADGQPFDAANGLGAAGHTGAVTIYENSPAHDLVAFNGAVDFFTLRLDSAGSSINPTESSTITPLINANFDGTYTIRSDAPAGWQVTMSDNGPIMVRPPSGAAPGDYLVLITAQSHQYPDLFVAALHTVTVTAYEGVALSVVADELITMPMGPVLDAEAETPGASGHLVDGRAEIPDAAYTIIITNTSSTPHTFDLAISGLPAGWTILSNAGRTTETTLSLGAGAVGQMGLYIDPTVTDLLPPGQNYAVNVTAVSQDNPGLTAGDDFTFTMPAVAFPYPQLSPEHQFITAGSPVSIDLIMANVGNVSGSFPVALTMPASIFNGTPLSPTLISSAQNWTTAVLSPQQSETAMINLTTNGAIPGRTYLLRAATIAGEYRPAAYTAVTIVSVISGPIFAGAQQIAESCPLNEPALSASLNALALAVASLEVACENGDCLPALRDQAVAAAEQAASYGRLASPLIQTYAELETAAAELAAASGDTAILEALPGLTTAVTNLTAEVCAISRHRATARLAPWMDAALPDQPVSYDLEITNRGTLATTYAVTVTLPNETLTFARTIAPGATEVTAVSASAADLALYLIAAEVTAVDVPIDYLTAHAQARLNVVDRFIQVTAVSADPPFVETGTSSTTLQVEIANVAGIGLSGVATTAVLAADGNLQWSDDIPLAILGGAPRSYELATVDTSGWAAGVYTITVDVQLHGEATTGGAGYGYLSVGQAVIPSHAVAPEMVAPGTVTVTTSITTEIASQQLTGSDGQSQQHTVYDAPYWNVEREKSTLDSELLSLSNGIETEPAAAGSGELPLIIEDAGDPSDSLNLDDEDITAPLTFDNADIPEEQLLSDDDRLSLANEEAGDAADSLTVDTFDASLTVEPSPLTLNNSFVRTEQDDPAISYTGSWTNLNLNMASGGSYWRNATAGSTAEFSFDAEWLNVGFIGTHWGGHVEIAIDGDSQGLFDLYRREDNTAINLVFAGLDAGPHTVTITVAGSSNPFSSGSRVQLDFIDAWDGAPLGDGLFEENHERVLRSNGWTDGSHANASGGSYVRGGSVTAWFPFDGDSFTYHAMAYNGGGKAHIFVDGQYLDTVDFYHPVSISGAVSRTFSYDGFGPGPHILQISSYRDQTTLDALETPGQPPFIDPDPAPGSINRYEEDHPAILYNGVPYTQTTQSWSRISGILATGASDGQYLRSATAGDAFSFDFEGSWLNLGFYADRFGGYAEIFVDGDSQGVVDLYRREDTLVTFFYGELPPGSHNVTIAVPGSSNPFASGSRVQFDFVEFGDGSGLGHGTFEQDDDRILLSGGWTTENNAGAGGGSFIRSGNGHAWFHFEGDSFTYQAMAFNLANRARLYVDGRYLDTVELYHPNSLANAITRTFSYEGFGPGPHVLQISAYRSNVALDAITTPGQAPFIDPNPPLTGIARFEEDHPAIRYNGAPFTQTAQSWLRVNNITSDRASDGQYIYSATAGDTISFDFESSWIGVGFAVDRFGGQAEIAIDGDMVAAVDLYTRDEDTESLYFSDLGDGPHTITITVLGTRHINSIGSRVHLDYFDVWDGQLLDEGTFEETDERIFYSSGWGRTLNVDASGGGYATSGASNSTAWFPFTGDSVTFHSWTHPVYHSIELKIDGVSQGHFNTYDFEAGPRAFSFEGLGDGSHVLEVRKYRGNVTVDAFITPATGEHYEMPAPSGVIRLEEDHPDLRYNGYAARVMPQSWSTESTLNNTSGGYNARTSTAGNTLSLEFEGTWVGVGFRSASWSGVAEIFIDGVSRGTFDTTDFAGGITSFYFDDLDAGSHTIEVTAVSGTVMPDFIDIWDGQPLEDGWYNATLDDYSGRFHYSNKNWWGQYEEHYAHEGDYVRQSLINAHPNIWFTFVGRDLTLLTRNGNNALLDITIDGQHMGEFNLTPEFSNQPDALHFPDLGDGPHVVQIHTRNFGVIDAFEVNPADFYSYTPQVKWHDDSAKESLDPAFGTGFLTTIGIGNLNGDGNVELVAPGVNGRLYVYRGDGADTGDGTPILWTSDLVGVAAEPALADLTGDGAAEIIVSGYHGLFAFRHDGTVLWHEESIKAYTGDIGGLFGWGGPTVGNLDNDPQPEIVIAASEDALYVLDHQGNILASDPIGRWPSVPVLADITGDGTLDIIAAQGHTLKVYAFDSLAGLEIAWSYTLTNTTLRSGVFGSPAVADITGDGQPEIIINWGHRIEALTADGSLLWSYYTGDDSHYRPSPITVADVTGDGQKNLITASAINAGFLVFNHMLMVLNLDGSLLWQQTVADNTASASGVAAQDLTGDGAWEILWNGATDGFLIIRGSDGKRLFNEPVTKSGTIMEYPALGDVDGDGVADVVVAGREGIFVISHVGHWINSRPMWNQHNYHVTNINDDWSVPFAAPNSWEVHNTYRTQTPEQNPAPSYRVEITHTVDIDNVTVLTDTFSTPATGTPPAYQWAYQLEWYAPVNTITFNSELAGMQPGETRQVNNGTEISYRLPSGWNYLTLPPLYVTAARILEIAPDSQTVGVGGTAVYTLTLFNPGLVDDLYSLELLGLPAGWAGYPASVNVPAQSSVEVLVEVTASPEVDLTEWPFLINATTGGGGQDMVTASLTLFNGLAIAISPAEQSAPTGTAVTYSLTLTNSQQVTVNSQLSTAGLAQVELPGEVEVPAEAAVTLPITVTSTTPGPQPFTVTAVTAGGSDAADAVLMAEGNDAVGLFLEPESQVAGPATPALFILTVTNPGDTAGSYDLSLDLPAGWTGALDANGAPLDSIMLPPHIFNSADLRLRVTPDLAATPGNYEIGVTATAQSGPGVQATVTGTVELLPLGVQVSISPQQTTMSPLASGAWQVTITNTGSVVDSFDLTPAGAISLAAALSSHTVTLNPGQSQTVQMTTEPLPFLLPQTYPFWVIAVSQTDERIANVGEAAVTFTGYEGVSVAWQPAEQAVTELSASFLLVVTNTGNIPTTYQFGLEMPGLSGRLPLEEMIIPARTAALLPLAVTAAGSGVYELLATAVSANGTGDSDTATLTITLPNQPPLINAGPDQTVIVNSVVQFNGSASDPDDDPLTFAWEFGDGNGASGSLTPSHVYEEIGAYTVTLTVGDTAGHVVSDTLQLTVVAEEIFEVDAGPDREANEGNPLTFSGIITDTAGLEPYTIAWEFGDGNTAEGSLTPSHTYAGNGVYTVTLTVTNSEDQVAADSLVVTVHNVPPTVTAVADQTLFINETLSGILATFTDLGMLDTHTAGVDWGDGTVADGVVDQGAGTVSGAHTYTAVGVYTVTVTVTDNDGDAGSDSLTVTVLPEAVSSCELYPIGLHVNLLNGVAPGDVIDNIFNGKQPGNFGWLTWTGAPSVLVLINSLTPPGDSHTYVNPDDPDDHVVAVGDWVYGRPGVANARNIRVTLDALKSVDIVVPVWDVAEDHDDVTRYRVAGFAQVRLISYHLPEENRISVRFLGDVSCAESAPDESITGADGSAITEQPYSIFLPQLSRNN